MYRGNLFKVFLFFFLFIFQGFTIYSFFIAVCLLVSSHYVTCCLGFFTPASPLLQTGTLNVSACQRGFPTLRINTISTGFKRFFFIFLFQYFTTTFLLSCQIKESCQMIITCLNILNTRFILFFISILRGA